MAFGCSLNLLSAKMFRPTAQDLDLEPMAEASRWEWEEQSMLGSDSGAVESGFGISAGVLTPLRLSVHVLSEMESWPMGRAQNLYEVS